MTSRVFTPRDAWQPVRRRDTGTAARGDLLREAGPVAFLTWLATCLTLAAWALLVYLPPDWGHRATAEDGPVENLTVVAFLLAGIVFSATAWRRRGLPRFALAALAAGALFVCGEEISWGQRILGFATPDFLSHNIQGEANLHNLRRWPRFFRLAQLLFITVLCVVTAVGAMRRRDAWLGVPLPSLPLALAVLGAHAALLDAGVYSISIDFGGLGGIRSSVPLLVVAAYAAFTRRAGLLLAAAAMLALVAAVGHIHQPTFDNTSPAELWELLVGVFWLGYAAEALLGRGSPPPPPMTAWAWPLASCAVLALAAGLGAFDYKVNRAILEEARRLSESAAPAGQAAFSVALHPGRVAYFKRPCRQADIDAGAFFLHVFPERLDDLPVVSHRVSGFENLDFKFALYGAIATGVCGTVVPVPDYAIARILTGQYNDAGKLWEVRLP